jgi:hypothetical protein
MVRDLHLTSPMMTGTDVLAVQERLAALEYAPGVLDGAYGPATTAALCGFQRDQRLVSDGVCGPVTRGALEMARDLGGPAASVIGQQALAEALRHLGVTEAPPGSNRTPFGAWFGVDGVPWCNIFVSYCFSVGAGYVIASDFPGGHGNGIYTGKGCAYVPTTEAWLRASALWLGTVAPLAGDIAIYNWDGGEPDHIGIVSRYLGDGTFEAIEGNTAVGNDSNGGAVMLRKRHLTQVDGFGRVSAPLA